MATIITTMAITTMIMGTITTVMTLMNIGITMVMGMETTITLRQRQLRNPNGTYTGGGFRMQRKSRLTRASASDCLEC